MAFTYKQGRNYAKNCLITLMNFVSKDDELYTVLLVIDNHSMLQNIFEFALLEFCCFTFCFKTGL